MSHNFFDYVGGQGQSFEYGGGTMEAAFDAKAPVVLYQRDVARRGTRALEPSQGPSQNDHIVYHLACH